MLIFNAEESKCGCGGHAITLFTHRGKELKMNTDHTAGQESNQEVINKVEKRELSLMSQQTLAELFDIEIANVAFTCTEARIGTAG